jgi:hypothetical protein
MQLPEDLSDLTIKSLTALTDRGSATSARETLLTLLKHYHYDDDNPSTRFLS